MPRTARRVHLILLRADGLSWQQIMTVLFCSFDLISQTLKALAAGGVAAVLEQRPPTHSGSPVGLFSRSKRARDMSGVPLAR
jgi:hypothetical protein